MNKLNIDTKDVIIFGDSYHSDGQMMKVITDGVWVCPGNSDDRLKEEIKNRGKLGYVAEKPFFEGTMDAIHHFFDWELDLLTYYFLWIYEKNIICMWFSAPPNA